MAQKLEVIRRVRGGPSDAVLMRIARLVFGQLKRRQSTVTLTFVGDTAMRTLNRRTRGRDQTTDVLSFPAADKSHPSFPAADASMASFLGDVVISLPEARRQGIERGLSLTTVVCELFIHGILHCAGYDHERPVQARRMLPLQAHLLRRATSRYVA